jgi:hypothetical protein
MVSTHHSHSHLSDWQWRGGIVLPKLSVATEVDVNDSTAVELIKHVLSRRPDSAQALAVDLAGISAKSTLGTGDSQRMVAQN